MSIVSDRLSDLRAHIRCSPAALDELGDAMGLEWSEVDDGIEATRADQLIRVTRDEIEIRNVRFGGKKVIPLR